MMDPQRSGGQEEESKTAEYRSSCWFVLDVCGIGCLLLTQLIIYFSCYTVCINVLFRWHALGVWRTVWAGTLLVMSALASLAHMKCVFSDPGAVPRMDADAFAAIQPPPSQQSSSSGADLPAVDVCEQPSRTGERNVATADHTHRPSSDDGGVQGESTACTSCSSSGERRSRKTSTKAAADFPMPVSTAQDLRPPQHHAAELVLMRERNKGTTRRQLERDVLDFSEDESEEEALTFFRKSVEPAAAAATTVGAVSVAQELLEADGGHDGAPFSNPVCAARNTSPQSASDSEGGGGFCGDATATAAAAVAARRTVLLAAASTGGDRPAGSAQAPPSTGDAAAKNERTPDVAVCVDDPLSSRKRRGKEVRTHAFFVGSAENSNDGRCDAATTAAGSAGPQGRTSADYTGEPGRRSSAHKEAGRDRGRCRSVSHSDEDSRSTTSSSNVVDGVNTDAVRKRTLCCSCSSGSSSTRNGRVGAEGAGTCRAAGVVSSSRLRWCWPMSVARVNGYVEWERLATSAALADAVHEDTAEERRRGSGCRRGRRCWAAATHAAEALHSHSVLLRLVLFCFIAAAQLLRLAWMVLSSSAAALAGGVAAFFVSPTFSAAQLPLVQEALERGVQVPVCMRCRGVKPQRAHHCSVCRRCIVKMDHHCPWINNCVGQLNQKFFLLFLLYVNGMCSLSIAALVSRLISCMRSDLDGRHPSYYSPVALQRDSVYTRSPFSMYGAAASDLRLHSPEVWRPDAASVFDVESLPLAPVFAPVFTPSKHTEEAAGRAAPAAPPTTVAAARMSHSPRQPPVANAATRLSPSHSAAASSGAPLPGAAAALENTPSITAASRQQTRTQQEDRRAAAEATDHPLKPTVYGVDGRFPISASVERESVTLPVGLSPAGEGSSAAVVDRVPSSVAHVEANKTGGVPGRSGKSYGLSFSAGGRSDAAAATAAPAASAPTTAAFSADTHAIEEEARREGGVNQENVDQQLPAETAVNEGPDASLDERNAIEERSPGASSGGSAGEAAAKDSGDVRETLEAAREREAGKAAPKGEVAGRTVQGGTAAGLAGGREALHRTAAARLESATGKAEGPQEEELHLNRASGSPPEDEKPSRFERPPRGADGTTHNSPGSSSSSRESKSNNSAEDVSDSHRNNSGDVHAGSSSNSNILGQDGSSTDSSVAGTSREGRRDPRLQLDRGLGNDWIEAGRRPESSAWHPAQSSAVLSAIGALTPEESAFICGCRPWEALACLGVFMCAFVFGLFTFVMLIDQLSCISANTTGIEVLKRSPRYEPKGLEVALTEVCGGPFSWRWFFPVNGASHRYGSYARLETELTAPASSGPGADALNDDRPAEGWSSASFSVSRG